MKNLSTLLLVVLLLPAISQAETIVQDNSTATNLGLYGGEVRDVASDPDSDYVYVTTYSPNGFFVSADDGATWQGLDASVYDLGEPRGVELDEAGNVYLLISEGLFKSSDHGTTLTEIGVDEVGQNGNNFIYQAGILMVGGNDGTVMVSTDGGNSFTVSAAIQPDSYVLSLAASPTTDTYYTTLDDTNNATLYMTTDRGVTWTEVNIDDVANRFTSIYTDPNDANHLVLLSYGEDVDPWQSFDAGATWDQFDVGAGTVGIMNVDGAGRIYLGTAYSDDGGTTWGAVESLTPSNRVSIIWPDSADDNRLYGTTFGAVAISDDRGLTWTDSNAGITAVTVQAVAQSLDKATVWIATNAGLAHTANFTDTTPTWEFPINYDYYPSAVWVSPADSNIVVVGGYLAIYRSVDGGANWETITNWNSDYAVQQLAGDPTNASVVYAVGATQNTLDPITGAVMMSTDSGATWTDLAIADTAAAQTAIVSADGTLYVGAGQLDIRGDSATGIYKYDGTDWLHLADSPDEQITSLTADPDNADVVYATAADFDSNQHSDGGVYKTTDGGSTWTELSSNPGLETASRFRVVTIQNSTNILYLAGTDTVTSAGTIWKSTNGGTTWGIYYVGLQNENFNTLLFDGLIAGNSRGAYDIRGQVAFTVKKSVTNITATLKDAATDKKLKHKKVTLWKKRRGDWVKVASDRTNSRAKASFNISPAQTSRYQLRYTPTGAAAEEYGNSRSNTITVRPR